jgi:hypothetical protein
VLRDLQHRHFKRPSAEKMGQRDRAVPGGTVAPAHPKPDGQCGGPAGRAKVASGMRLGCRTKLQRPANHATPIVAVVREAIPTDAATVATLSQQHPHGAVTENHGVGGSIPPLGTKISRNINNLCAGRN